MITVHGHPTIVPATAMHGFDPVEGLPGNVAMRHRLFVPANPSPEELLAEAVQNSVDAAEKQLAETGDGSTVLVEVDLVNNELSVTDTAGGIPAAWAVHALRPHVGDKSTAFREGRARGHKGLGLTALAYGCDSFRLESRTAEEHYTLTLAGARHWLQSDEVAPAPTAVLDPTPSDGTLTERGSRLTLRLTDRWRPCLSTVLPTAQAAHLALQTRTALGAIPALDPRITAQLHHTDPAAATTRLAVQPAYRYPHLTPDLAALDLTDFLTAAPRPLTVQQQAYDACYATWQAPDLIELLTARPPQHLDLLVDEHHRLRDYVRTHSISVYAMLGSSSAVADKIADAWQPLGAWHNLCAPAARMSTNRMVLPFQHPLGAAVEQLGDRLWLLAHFDSLDTGFARRSVSEEVGEVVDALAESTTAALAEAAAPLLRSPRTQPPGSDRRWA